MRTTCYCYAFTFFICLTVNEGKLLFSTLCSFSFAQSSTIACPKEKKNINNNNFCWNFVISPTPKFRSTCRKMFVMLEKPKCPNLTRCNKFWCMCVCVFVWMWQFKVSRLLNFLIYASYLFLRFLLYFFFFCFHTR